MTITVEMTADEVDKLPKISKERLEELKKKPIVYDEDCPKLSDEELAEFKRVNPIKTEKLS